MTPTTDRPCAATGLTSYRYRGQYGWVMIGARSDYEALTEARRSITGPATLDRLEIWTDGRYHPVPLETGWTL